MVLDALHMGHTGAHSQQVQADQLCGEVCELFDQFLKLLQNEMVCMTLCVLRGGDIIKEWPDTNYQWKIKPVFTCLGMFNLIPIRFNGCAIGLQTKKGEPIKKPWCLMTTVPQMVDAFHDKRCQCPKGTDHPELFGAEAADSSHYTDKCATWFTQHLKREQRTGSTSMKHGLKQQSLRPKKRCQEELSFEIIPDDFNDVSDDERGPMPNTGVEREVPEKTAHLEMSDFDKEMLQDQLMCVRRLLEAGFYDRDEYNICVSQAINGDRHAAAATAEEDWRWWTDDPDDQQPDLLEMVGYGFIWDSGCCQMSLASRAAQLNSAKFVFKPNRSQFNS